RAVASLLVYRLRQDDKHESLWLDLDPGLEEKVLKHLDHYRISERMEFIDHTQNLAQIHLAGPSARVVLEAMVGEPVPDLKELQDLSYSREGMTQHIRRHCPLSVPGYDLLCPRADQEAVWQRLIKIGAHPAGSDTYEVLRIEAGTPTYGKDLDDSRF